MARTKLTSRKQPVQTAPVPGETELSLPPLPEEDGSIPVQRPTVGGKSPNLKEYSRLLTQDLPKELTEESSSGSSSGSDSGSDSEADVIHPTVGGKGLGFTGVLAPITDVNFDSNSDSDSEAEAELPQVKVSPLPEVESAAPSQVIASGDVTEASLCL